MWKNNRPDDWKCKYLGKKANRYYELGADAMLEALTVAELRNRLLALGSPIIIPGYELPQPKFADVPLPSDMTIYPYFISEEE